MRLDQLPPTVFTLEKARSNVEILCAADPDWNYQVDVLADGSGAHISAYDNEVFLGHF